MHPSLKALREALITDSYDSLAIRLRVASNEAITISGNSVRLWFDEARIPLYPLLLMIEWTEGFIPNSLVADLYPWTKKYFKEEFFHEQPLP